VLGLTPQIGRYLLREQATVPPRRENAPAILAAEQCGPPRQRPPIPRLGQRDRPRESPGTQRHEQPADAAERRQPEQTREIDQFDRQDRSPGQPQKERQKAEIDADRQPVIALLSQIAEWR